MSYLCDCCAPLHETRRVVLTGGPGAGKTSVLELVRRSFCKHVAVLPEAAGIVISGGFPRFDAEPARRAAQRAIFQLQIEVENVYMSESGVGVALCDRGTVDGIAYWPGAPSDYWQDLRTTREEQMLRCAAVIHLRTPPAGGGYNH